METGAFTQLTRRYMREEFNPKTPDLSDVRYFSYGATVEPKLWSVFRQSHRIVEEHEGPNDGLVSVASSKWGGEQGYKGTLVDVSHLDLINWTNKLRWMVWQLVGNKRNFNAIAFYLDIADKSAKAAMSARVQLDRPHDHFTNLDFVTGRVILQLPRDETIASVVVKLEGESKTKLEGPRSVYGPDRQDNRTKVELEVHKLLYKVLTIFPSPEIKSSPANSGYTLKAGQHSYPFKFKHADFKFLPIEPPRPVHQSALMAGESYGRLHFEYTDIIKSPKRSGLFGNIRATSPPTPAGVPPRITIDARLPYPAIITCNEPLPLRILVRKESDFVKSIHLQSLQIELIAYTKIRAHEFDRTESGSWVILSSSNINAPIGTDTDAVGTEWILNRSLWERIALPNTVAPGFETCNISRRYELEARVGLTYGRPGTPQAQPTVHPLRMPVQVYSGIAPPPALLSIMADSQSAPLPFTPSSAAAGDAPPSYEDAMAIELAPVDGPRRQYAQANAAGPSGFGDDRKMSASSAYDYSKVL
ncbi:MAG: hypothetical protein M1835_002117 [Candelina submexicana]|nr:MAG: hypothetical protein M1835_002117 [Candelina submexicana]